MYLKYMITISFFTFYFNIFSNHNTVNKIDPINNFIRAFYTNCHQTDTLKDTNIAISVKTDKSTFLYGSKATWIAGELKKQGGDYFEWKGNAEMGWSIRTSVVEKYDLFLIADIPAENINSEMIFHYDDSTLKFTLSPTFGPWKGEGKNFQRIKVLSKVLLPKGDQKITLKTTGISTDNILLNIRSIELVPVSAYQSIENENKRAIASRASTSWLVKTGYGLMFHWTSQSVQPDGSHKTYEQAVNDFDVKKFAKMIEETGAGYVILTIGHAESYCPAPIKSWEKVHPGHTTERDLIEEIAITLNSKGVKLICYINGPLGFNLNVKETPTELEKKAFVTNFKSILSEMGTRYGQKVAGYWFDSWYQIFEKFPEVPFEEFNKAAKTGNKDRIICLNSWIYPSVTPWQDYWAGEVASPVAVPENGFMKGGPVPDLPYQALLIMEPYWVQEKAEMPDPRFTSADLSQYIRNCMNNGGAVTINLGIYQNGTVGEKALEVMKEVRQKIRNGK